MSFSGGGASPCETFSENFSHTEKCQKCTQCTGLMRMETPCTDANDAICACNYGYYLDNVMQRCLPCTRCPEGMGMLMSCELDRDTVCEECTMDTYSDQESSREPCMPCSTCEESEVVQECSSTSDTICLVFTNRLHCQTSITISAVEPGNTGRLKKDSRKIIPQNSEVWCEEEQEQNHSTTTTTTLLKSVVLVLLAYCSGNGMWNNCKQNKQGANNCTANPNQTPSPEGEKLHSDSGISVDSQSLQEQQGQTQTHTVLMMDEEPCLLMPLHTEKVEQLMFRGSDGDNCNMDDSDWSNLAALLGYEEERIATFRQEDHPVRALLSDWASKDSASLDALCTALRKINREDIAQSLVLTKPTATSVV
ncbi:hypothetical protein WMY93_010898 [Mugilogobius chulae]|uniref:Nerve growth factor receptor b n=1 Tax=Mugilogobius chulae TaxID=88201 RepID=A0AAW0PJ22_9GOBI